MSDKVTMKITEEAHKSLQMAKALAGAKTFSEIILLVSQEYIEPRISKRKK